MEMTKEIVTNGGFFVVYADGTIGLYMNRIVITLFVLAAMFIWGRYSD